MRRGRRSRRRRGGEGLRRKRGEEDASVEEKGLGWGRRSKADGTGREEEGLKRRVKRKTEKKEKDGKGGDGEERRG